MGSVLDELGKPKESLSCIQKALSFDSLNPEYLYMLGDIQLKLKLFEESIESYKKVSEIDISNEEIWLDYSNAYKESEQIDMAIEILQKGIERHPENISLKYRYVNYLIFNLEEKEAYEILEEALINDFSKHTEFLDYDSDLKNNPQIMNLIDLYKK